MSWFSSIAPFLTHPLVLAGLALALTFGVHRALIRAKLIPPLSRTQGGQVLRIILRYGFWLAFLVVVLGFALSFFDKWTQASSGSKVQDEVHLALNSELHQKLIEREVELKLSKDQINFLQAQLEKAQEQIRSLKSDPKSQVRQDAIDADEKLKQGETQSANALLQMIKAERQQTGDLVGAGQIALMQGALAVLADPAKAKEYFAEAAALDPANANAHAITQSIPSRKSGVGGAVVDRVRALAEARSLAEIAAQAARAKDFDKAANAYASCRTRLLSFGPPDIDTDPNLLILDCQLGQGEALVKLRRLDEARRAYAVGYEAATKIIGSNSDPRFRKHQSEFKERIESLTEASMKPR
jgi:hypothetical protein